MTEELKSAEKIAKNESEWMDEKKLSEAIWNEIFKKSIFCVDLLMIDQ